MPAASTRTPEAAANAKTPMVQRRGEPTVSMALTTSMARLTVNAERLSVTQIKKRSYRLACRELEHRAEKWIPVFGGKRCGNKKREHRA